MRTPRAVVLTLVACASLAGCADPGPAPEPTATHSREVASAYRCLADHSPWTLDLDRVYSEWFEAADADGELSGGTVTGTAELSFTRGDAPTWRFTARGVAYELFFASGVRETTTIARELTGGYTLPEPGGLLTLTSVRIVTDETDAASVSDDGTRTVGTSVAAPRFPWDADAGTMLAMTCTEHRLVVSAPGHTPDTWDLSPG